MKVDNKSLVVLILVPELPVNLKQLKSGVHTALLNLINGFKNNTTDKIIIVSFNKNLSKSVKTMIGDTEVYYLWEGPFPFHTLNYLTWSSFRLYRFFRKINADILHYQVGNGFLLTSLFIPKRILRILTIHGHVLKEANIKRKITDRLTWKINYYLSRLIHVPYVIHLSNYSKNNHSLANSLKTVVIPNSISTNHNVVSENSENYNKKLLFIGQTDVNKNLIWIIKLLKDLVKSDPDYQLVVAGGITDRIYFNRCVKLINDYDLNNKIHFLGWCDDDMKKKWLNVVDYLIVPSIHESFPMVVLEGMEAGVIVLANETGGIPEMIEDKKSGFLFRLENPEALLSTIKILDANPDLRNEIKQNARKHIQNNFLTEFIAEDTIQFYHEVKNEQTIF